jgi:hypothetical protein
VADGGRPRDLLLGAGEFGEPERAGRFGGGLIDVTNGFRFTLDGTGAGIQIFPESYGASILSLPFGGFLTLCFLIAAMQYALKKAEDKKAKKAAKEKEAEK